MLKIKKKFQLLTVLHTDTPEESGTFFNSEHPWIKATVALRYNRAVNRGKSKCRQCCMVPFMGSFHGFYSVHHSVQGHTSTFVFFSVTILF